MFSGKRSFAVETLLNRGNQRPWRRSLALALTAASLAWVAPLELRADDSVPPPVFGGELSKDCAWPTVVMVHMFKPEDPEGQQYGLCTGTLVHPRVVVFASHCGDAIGVSVGQDRHAPNRITEFEKVGRNPDWQNHPQYTKVDWAYAVLKEPLKGAATIPIAYGCELDMVQKKGQDVCLVGYSDNGASGAMPNPDEFLQRWANAKVTQLGGGVLFAGASGVGVRSGDSGGPVLAQLKDGTWRTMAIVSRADGSAAAVNKEMIQWLNKETGIDLVPCFDDDGKPTEGKECDALRAFSGDPSAPVAKKEDNCIGAPSKWAGLACGLQKSDGSDPGSDPDKSPDEDSSKDKTPDADNSKDGTPDGSNSEGDNSKTSKSKDSKSDTEETGGKSSETKNPKGNGSDDKSSGSDKDKTKEPSELVPGACSLLPGQSAPGFSLAALLGLIGLRRRKKA